MKTPFKRFILCLGIVLLSFPTMAQPSDAEKEKAMQDLGGKPVERLFMTLPKEWKPVRRRKHNGQTLLEFIPSKDTDARWEEKLTVIILHSQSLDAQKVAVSLSANYTKHCKSHLATEVANSPEGRYPSHIGYLECRDNSLIGQLPFDVRKFEVMAQKVLKGADATYIVQRAYHADAPIENFSKGEKAKEMVSFLVRTRVCDNRIEEVNCAKFLSK